MVQQVTYTTSGFPPAFGLVSSSAYSSALKIEATYPPKRRLTYNRLHGVISLKTEFFITTVVKTSNPTLPTQLVETFLRKTSAYRVYPSCSIYRIIAAVKTTRLAVSARSERLFPRLYHITSRILGAMSPLPPSFHGIVLD
jgi:hypothetical protein